MTTDQHRSQDDKLIHFSGSLANAHSQSALEQSALYEAQLAIARWSNASAPPQLARAAWYAQAQQNLQEWLGRGGFAQYDIPCAGQAPQVEATPNPAPASGTRPIGTCID